MARGRSRTIQVLQPLRRRTRIRRRLAAGGRSFLRSRGQFGRSGLLQKIEQGLGRGILYGGVASKIIPSLAPIATLYGEYSAGGIESLAINEFLVKPFIGQQSVLGNIFGSGGLNLGNLFGGGSSMQTGMGAMV